MCGLHVVCRNILITKTFVHFDERCSGETNDDKDSECYYAIFGNCGISMYIFSLTFAVRVHCQAHGLRRP